MEIRRAVLHGKCDLRLDTDSLADALAPDQVLVKTEVSALSTGTDLGNYLGDSTYVPDAPDYPRGVGYSNAGRIAKTGAAVKGLHVGDRVFSIRPHQSHFLAGAGDMLVRIPDNVSSEEASLAYLTALGLAALRQARYEAGENVVVIGLGIIGLSVIALARAMGANVLGVANSEIRARAAIEMGALGCVMSDDSGPVSSMRQILHGAEADIVVLTSNSWGSYFLSLDLARFGGRVSILGFPGRGQALPERNPLDPSPFYSKQLTLIGAGSSSRGEYPAQDVRFNLRRNLEYILDLMTSKRLNLAPLITHRLPSGRMREAYELARLRSKDLIAAVFDWRS
jgi:threonine dehydrogenase-like Zn-dependent dehydrogenase